MGPQAGLDLAQNVLAATAATTDQDHVPLIVASIPGGIPDRTEYLLGQVEQNPAEPMADVAERLIRAGATVLGVPCNSAHAAPIWEPLSARLHATAPEVQLLSLIDETMDHLQVMLPAGSRVGVLGTTGSYRLGLYSQALEAAGFEAIMPEQGIQERIVHPAIYDTEYGIKAHPAPVSRIARESVCGALAHLHDRGADAVILGCTELPLAMPESTFKDIPLINPGVLLARALVRATYPEKLRPLPRALA